jgi:hypothetical protein
MPSRTQGAREADAQRQHRAAASTIPSYLPFLQNAKERGRRASGYYMAKLNQRRRERTRTCCADLRAAQGAGRTLRAAHFAALRAAPQDGGDAETVNKFLGDVKAAVTDLE